ncbi:hypothetical protein [Paenibacillus sp. FSL L8-0323]|uniref:hypothetical protein n=1 Tax=unclassified Paenibacillus TaxID=185978 RepID=UPI0030FA3FC5
MLRRHAHKKKVAKVTTFNVSINIQNERTMNEIINSVSRRLEEDIISSSSRIYSEVSKPFVTLTPSVNVKA